MEDMAISEAARRTGVPATTLRYYEDEGVLPPAARRNGRRVYDEQMVRLIQVAAFAQSVGFTLDEMKRLFKGLEGRTDLRAQWKPLARAKLAQLDEVIARAQRMKAAIAAGLECGCIRIEDCVVAESTATTPGPRRDR
jgi:MerR family transcriptional regulator, redox-sensitive transcriptional activator SoxR